MRCSCVLQLSRRRVRGTHGLGVVSYVWRLALAAHWLRRILEGWIGILRAPVRSRCRRRCPRGRVMGSWGCGVGKVVCGRRILNIARLGIRDARRRACRGRGTRKGRGLRIARSLVRREIGVVPHGNGFARWCRILLTLTRLPNLILRGCSSVVSCTVSLRLAPIMAA